MSKPIRCWHLLSNRWNSAITEYALSAVKSLNISGAENVISPLHQSPAEQRAKKYGFAVEPFSSFGLSQIARARNIFRDFSPDIMFLYGGPETVMAGFLPDTRAKIRFRGQEMTSSLLGNFQQKMSHRHIDRIVVPGAGLEKVCGSIYGPGKVTAVTLGCDSEIYFRKEALVRPDRPELLVFGRFDAVKGHREFLKIFRRMLDRWPEHEPTPMLTYAGQPEGVTVEMLREAAQMCGVSEENFRIHTGRFEDVGAMMSAATVGVVPSLGSELICRVAEEFLLCGTPVAVSGVGSLDDVLLHGAGLSYRGYNLDDTAAMLHQLVMKSFSENESQKNERAAAARNMFSFEKMASGLLAAAGITA